ncbi:MAG: hypothetical protein SVX43_16770, partial [Cyanobacteriota bacterium]|nr:hypothetical protein [Cyanobacteriota bacterium]
TRCDKVRGARSPQEITVWVEPLDRFALLQFVGLRKPPHRRFVGVYGRRYRSWIPGDAETH